MWVAISTLSGTPSSWIRSNTISPHAAAETSNQFTAPYRELPRWWSMLITNPRSRPPTPVRSRLPDSMTITASPGSFTWSATSMSPTPGNTASDGGAASRLTTRTSLPRWRNAYAIASWEPMASPSGRTWEESTKRCRLWISAATCARVADSVAVVLIVSGDIPLGVLLVEVAEYLLDAVLVADRLVEPEINFGNAPQPHAIANLAAEEGSGSLERLGG